MEILLIAGVVCLFGGIACVFGGMRMLARRGFRRIKAGITLGRTGFYMEADGREGLGKDNQRVGGPYAHRALSIEDGTARRDALQRAPNTILGTKVRSTRD
jgi:hypothetical protein